MKIFPNTYNPHGMPTIWCRPHWSYGICSQLPAAVVCIAAFACAGIEGVPFAKAIALLACAFALVILYNSLYYGLMAFEISDEQIAVATGVFDKDIERIELYRVCDYRISRPLLLRILGLENIRIYSTDRTMPVLLVPAMKSSDRIVDEIRKRVEIQKRSRNVYELVNR